MSRADDIIPKPGEPSRLPEILAVAAAKLETQTAIELMIRSRADQAAEAGDRSLADVLESLANDISAGLGGLFADEAKDRVAARTAALAAKITFQR